MSLSETGWPPRRAAATARKRGAKRIAKLGATAALASLASVVSLAARADVAATWSSTADSPDWATAVVGDLLAKQNPWNAADMAPGDRFETRLRLAGEPPKPWLDVLTGPLTMGSGLPKGAPSLLLGRHYGFVSPVDPFAHPDGPGLSVADIAEFVVVVDAEDRSGPDASWAKAIQLYGFLSEPGPDWSDRIDADIQIRFASLDFPSVSVFQPHYVADLRLDGRRWRVSDEALDGDSRRRSYLFDAMFEAERPLTLDLRPFLAWVERRHERRREGGETAPMRFPGVSVWIEPRAGAIETSIGAFSVRLNGRRFSGADPEDDVSGQRSGN